MTDVLIKIVAMVALLVVLFFGEQTIERRGYDRRAVEDTAATEQLKQEAAAALASETGKTRAAEQALQTQTNQQETQDADHQKTIADLSNHLRHSAGPGGRLRDPHAAAGCGPGGGSAPGAAASAPGDRADDAAVAGGLLSADLTGLLQRLTAEADTINTAYASCRADAYTVRASP